MNERSGHYVRTETGYSAYIPKKLPPDPEIKFDWEMQKLLSDADRNLGRLDGITEILPNPQLFVAMYVKKEALISSQIEGTQASLVDVLDSDIADDPKKRNDIADVVNYVKAMKYGLTRIDQLPLSLRLIREIHAELIQNTRGANKNPGEFRTSQNWIGPQNCKLEDASFVPPTVDNMIKALGDLELFMHEKDHIPPLIKISLIHAQFETIHPFLDGNGRMGRLLITFWLCHQKILNQPLLYLSYYFKKNRAEYYDRLMDVRFKGAWEQWIKFFLKGISEVANEATSSAKNIIDLKEDLSDALSANITGGYWQKLLDLLFEKPIITRSDIVTHLGTTSPTAKDLVDKFCVLKILDDKTPDRQRNKKYAFQAYLNILEPGTE